MVKDKVHLKITIGVLLVLAAVFYLIIAGLSSAQAAYYLKVGEALQGHIEQGRYYRIEGKIAGDSVSFDSKSNPVVLKFQIYDDNVPQQKLTVIYNDVEPDNFTEATSAVVEGRFNQDGAFQADTLSLKCPSKYDEASPSQQKDGAITKFLKSIGLKK